MSDDGGANGGACDFDHPIAEKTHLALRSRVIDVLSKLPFLLSMSVGLCARRISTTRQRRRSLEKIDCHLRVILFDA